MLARKPMAMASEETEAEFYARRFEMAKVLFKDLGEPRDEWERTMLVGAKEDLDAASKGIAWDHLDIVFGLLAAVLRWRRAVEPVVVRED
ncbi:MAG: hypothetical protein WCJ76_08765 [Comamonadaceae bacterium]